MIDNEEYYILGLPIETQLGQVRFVKVKDYPNISQYLYVVSLTKMAIIYNYQKINKGGVLDELIDVLKDESNALYEIYKYLPDVKEAYDKVLSFVFDDEFIIHSINEDNFYYFRRLILRMNAMKEKTVNPNPEIQAWNEKSERAKREELGILTFSDIASSIVGYNGLSYADLNEMTMFQFYTTFHRISFIKGHDTTSLFATVSNEVKVEQWCKHIDLFEEENHGISRKEFMSKTDFNS